MNFETFSSRKAETRRAGTRRQIQKKVTRFASGAQVCLWEWSIARGLAAAGQREHAIRGCSMRGASFVRFVQIEIKQEVRAEQ